LKPKELFQDPFFKLSTPKNELILTNKGESFIKWLRPKEIIEQPTFGLESGKYNEVVQGMLDNCAFISACSSITKYDYLLKNV
jgi:hypothetical protein